MLGVPLNRYGGTGLQLGVMTGEADLVAWSDQVGVELRPMDIVAPGTRHALQIYLALDIIVPLHPILMG